MINLDFYSFLLNLVRMKMGQVVAGIFRSELAFQ